MTMLASCPIFYLVPKSDDALSGVSQIRCTILGVPKIRIMISIWWSILGSPIKGNCHCHLRISCLVHGPDVHKICRIALEVCHDIPELFKLALWVGFWGFGLRGRPAIMRVRLHSRKPSFEKCPTVPRCPRI